MKTATKIILTHLLLLLAISISHAQQFKVTQYTEAQGLPTNSIRSIVQDQTGFIWIATDKGLVRYDGRKFQKYSDGLRGEYIRCVTLKADGNLLVSSDFGVSEVISQKDTVIIKTVIPGGILPSDTTVVYPNQLFEDSQGRIWISQPNGTVSYQYKGKLKHFDQGERNSTGKSDSHFSFVEDDKGTVWIASEPGIIFYYDESLDHVRELVSGRKKQKIHDLHYAGDGKLWVIGEGLDEIKYNDRRRAVGLENFSTISMELTKLIKKPNGEMFFGTPNFKLFIATKQNEQIGLKYIHIINEKHEYKELPFNEVRDAFVDDKGDIWIASEKGVNLLQTNFFGEFLQIPSAPVRGVTQLPIGDIYVSVGKLYKIYEDFGDTYQDEVYLPVDAGIVTSLANGYDRVWIGNEKGEVFYTQDYVPSEKVDLQFRGGEVFNMLYDSDGVLWVCQKPSTTGLEEFSGITRVIETGVNTWDIKPYQKDEGVETRIMVAKQRENGYIYFGGIGRDTYLYRYHKKSDSFFNLSVTLNVHDDRTFIVNDLAIDENDVVYLATSHGLFKYSAEKITQVNLGIDLESIEIRALTLNDDGTLWFSTDTDGLFQYSEGKLSRFEETSGLPTKIMSYRSLMTDNEQKVWVGTAEGIVVSQDARPKPKLTPKPTFLKLKVDGEDYELADLNSSFSNGSTLEASFIALTYPGSGLMYQTRLQAAGRAAEYFKDVSWSRASQNSEFRIENLPEGFYSFEVRAKQRGGYDWSEPLAITFEVDKIWYRTWWAYSLYILAALIAVWALIRFNTWRLLRDKNKLETIIHNRTAELVKKTELLEDQKKEILAQAEELKTASQEVAEQKNVVEESYENIKMLTKIGKQIMLSETLSEAELTITNYLNDIIDYSSFAIGVPSTDGTGLELSIFKKGKNSKFFKDFVPYSEKYSLLMWSWKNEKKLIINNLEKDCQNYIPNLSLKRDDMNYSQIYLPLNILGRNIGMMAIQHKYPNHYDEHHLIIFETLGTYVAVMLSRLFELEEK